MPSSAAAQSPHAHAQLAARRPPHLAAAACCLALAGSALAQSQIVYIDDDAPPGGDGRSWATAYREIPELMGYGGTEFEQFSLEVRLAQGTYRAKPNRRVMSVINAAYEACEFTFHLTGGYAGVTSPNPDHRDASLYPTILDADRLGNDGPNFTNREDNADAVLWLDTNSSDTIVLDSVTLRGAASNGAVFQYILVDVSKGGTLEARNCIFTENNSTWDGGVLYTHAPNVLFDSCTFSNNRAADGFGGALDFRYIYGPVNSSFGNRIISNCVFVNNHAAVGGAVASSTSVRITSTRFLDNSAEFDGGALFCNSDAVAADTLFAGNSAESGGAILITGDSYISRCTIANNHASLRGGALTSLYGLVRTSGSLWHENSTSSGPNHATLTNRLGMFLTSNDAISGGLAYISAAPDRVYARDGVLDVEPRFVDPVGPDANPNRAADNNYQLRADSPLIDQGGASGLAFDALHRLRWIDSNRDGLGRDETGAFEFIPNCLADITLDGFVDDQDFVTFADGYSDFICPTSIIQLHACPADLNRDALVDDADFTLFAAAYADFTCPQ